MLPQAWASLVASRVVAASTTLPSISGVVGITASLTGFGFITALTIKSGAASDFIIPPSSHEELPSISHTILTFGRVLIVPSLAEELIWRVALLPHPQVDGLLLASKSLPQLLGVNTCFALYHVLGGYVLEYTTGRSGAVIQKPSFLFLAFCLGGACTGSYYMAGCALYAPVLVHAIPVTLWLTFFGGENVLRGITHDNQGEEMESLSSENDK